MIQNVLSLALLMVGGSMLVSVAGLALVRRVVAPKVLREHHDVAGFILAIVGVIYAVLLAFAVLVVWERFDEADVVAVKEANAVVDIYRLTPGLPPAVRAEIRRDVRFYAKSVIEEEWLTMDTKGVNENTSRQADMLWSTCTSIKVQDASEAAILGQILTSLTGQSDNRRLRVLASHTGVPALMWIVLIVGGVATVLFTYYFGIEKFWVQAGMTAILAMVISLVLFLISGLNYPFTGDLGVKPEAMQTALERLDAIDEHEAKKSQGIGNRKPRSFIK